MITSSIYQSVKTEHEAICPSNVVIELDNERLLAVQAEELWGQISEDVGKTWTNPFRFTQNGSPMNGKPSGGCSLVLLSDGRLGMCYYVQGDSNAASYETRLWKFTISEDEGHSWGDAYPIDIPGGHDLSMGKFDQYLWGKAIQLSTGRIVLPVYWLNSGRHKGMPPTYADPVTATLKGNLITRVADGHLYEAAMAGCYTYHSDDLGQTWQRSLGSVMVWPLSSENHVGGFGATTEPIMIELKNGSVMMHMRTNVGQILQSFSKDGGHEWSQSEMSGLTSGDVPSWLGRLKTTGDILTIWNQTSPEEIKRGYSRGRLSIAISNDEAKTWTRHQTVALSQGLDPIEYVEPPLLRHVRSDSNLGTLPDNYARFDYPRVAFVQEQVVLLYKAVDHVDGKWLPRHILATVPEKDL